MTFNDFIEKHLSVLSDISSYGQGIDWYEKTYKGQEYSKDFFSPIKDSDPELYTNLEYLHQEEYRCLNRKQVFEILNQDGNEYRGFIAVMVWGGLGTGGSKKDSFKTILASSNKIAIETKIKSIKAILSDNCGDRERWKASVKKAYESLDSGDNKITGISTSYLTKILYFLTFENTEVTPLIYDNQSKRIHAALLKDANALSGKFAIGYNNKNGFYCEPKGVRESGWNKFDFYWDYIKRMKEISEGYSIESGRLEEILFNKKLNSKGARAEDENGIPVWPRWFVRKYIESATNIGSSLPRQRSEGESNARTLDTNISYAESWSRTMSFKVRQNCAYLIDYEELPSCVNKLRFEFNEVSVTIDRPFKNFLNRGTFPQKAYQLLLSNGFISNNTYTVNCQIINGDLILSLSR